MKKFTVGTALVDPAANEVQKDGDIVRLEPKAVEVLCLLASKAGQTVSLGSGRSYRYRGVGDWRSAHTGDCEENV